MYSIIEYIMQSKTMKKCKKLFSFALALVVAASIIPADLAKAADTDPIGIDVSWEEGTIDWEQASAEVDFAVIRATEGTTVDDEFANNADGCTANGVPFGVSVYTLAQTADDAIAEAETVVAMLEGYTVDLPIYMEFEDADMFALSDAEILAVVTAFVDTITAAGYEAGLYATIDTYNYYFAEDTYYAGLNIWVSDLDSTTLPLESADMWQYSWDGVVAGVDSDASLNYYYGDLPVEEHTHTPVVDAAVPPTCTETGLTEGSHCSECGEVLVAQEVVPELGHTPKAVEGKQPTCTDTGLTEGSVCDVCGETLTAQEVIDAAGHKAGEEVHENVIDGVSYDKVVYCSVCKEELSRETVALTDSALKISGASLKIENDITVLVKSNLTTVGSYINPYIIVVQELEDGETKETKVEGVVEGTAYVFRYEGVEAKQVGDEFVCTIYAYDANGYVVKGASAAPYSAKKYCDTQIKKNISVSGQEKLVTLLVDLLNYGAAAQEFFNYKEDALVNADLTAEEQAKASPDSVLDSLENITLAAYETIDNPTVIFKGATLDLKNKVFVQANVAYTGDMTNVKAIFTVSGVDYEITDWEYDATKGYYKFVCDDVAAFQFEEPVYIKIMDGDTVISNTARYSVGSYAFRYKTDSSVGAVVCAMMKYGKAAYAYMVN